MLQTHILKQTCEDHFQCSKAPQIPCGQKDKRNMRNIFQRQLQGMGFGDCTAPLSHEKMKIQELSYRAVTLSFSDNKQHLLKMLLLLICNSMSVNDSFQARVVNSIPGLIHAHAINTKPNRIFSFFIPSPIP